MNNNLIKLAALGDIFSSIADRNSRLSDETAGTTGRARQALRHSANIGSNMLADRIDPAGNRTGGYIRDNFMRPVGGSTAPASVPPAQAAQSVSPAPVSQAVPQAPAAQYKRDSLGTRAENQARAVRKEFGGAVGMRNSPTASARSAQQPAKTTSASQSGGQQRFSSYSQMAKAYRDSNGGNVTGSQLANMFGNRMIHKNTTFDMGLVGNAIKGGMKSDQLNGAATNIGRAGSASAMFAKQRGGKAPATAPAVAFKDGATNVPNIKNVVIAPGARGEAVPRPTPNISGGEPDLSRALVDVSGVSGPTMSWSNALTSTTRTPQPAVQQLAQGARVPQAPATPAASPRVTVTPPFDQKITVTKVPQRATPIAARSAVPSPAKKPG